MHNKSEFIFQVGQKNLMNEQIKAHQEYRSNGNQDNSLRFIIGWMFQMSLITGQNQ